MEWLEKKNDNSLILQLMDKFKLTRLQSNLLVNRGIKDIESANKYLFGDISMLYNPYLLSDLELGRDIIISAIKNDEKITIYGDYDCDGTTSISVGVLGLKALGVKVDYYIPHRTFEGYGMNLDAIKKIKENGTDLIITVDNGIASIEEIKYAKKLGMKVIVTDHHDCPIITEEDLLEKFKMKKILKVPGDFNSLLPEVIEKARAEGVRLIPEDEYLSYLPDADALINPKLSYCNYPFKGLCGCGVIWKLLSAVYENIGGNLDYLDDLLSLVAIGTIADMMDLVDENRILVKEGLARLNAKVNVGINEMMNLFELDEIKSENIGFKIGPCLNADGRLQDARKAVELLITEDSARAMELAKYLNEVNDKRKEDTLESVENAERYIKENNLQDNDFIVVFHPEIHEGLVGLVASRIKEKYQVPCFVFTEGEEYFKASGRGVEGHPLSLFEALQSNKELWVKGGGHKMAAGVSIEKDFKLLKAFSDALNKMTKKLLEKHPFEPYIEYDEVLDNPTDETCREIAILEPVGKGNRKAQFITNEIAITRANPVGDGTHLSIYFSDFVTDSGEVFQRKGIGFGKTALYQEIGSPLKLRVAYTPNINIWNRKNNDNTTTTFRSVQMQIRDIKSLESGDYRALLISSLKSASS